MSGNGGKPAAVLHRNLEVEEVQGHFVVRGRVPSHHTKQLALQGALELLSGDRCSAFITVG